MAMMPGELFIKSEPNTAIVDVLCITVDCKFNLVNASNTADDKEARCNLKCITIKDGKCKNYEFLIPDYEATHNYKDAIGVEK